MTEAEPERFHTSIDLDVPIAVVWAALTDGSQLSAWFGDDVELDAFPGGQLAVRTHAGRRRAVIVDLEPERALVFRWLPDHRPVGFVWLPDDTPAGASGEVSFLLEPIPSGTRLTVVELSPSLTRPGASSALASA